MNLYLLSSDESLIQQTRNHEAFSSVKSIHAVEEIRQIDGEGIVLLSDRHISINEITNLVLPSDKKVFFMIQNDVYSPNQLKTTKAICESRDIGLIPPRLTVEQIIEKILESLNPVSMTDNNAITFFSSIGNSGTTSICLSAASALSEYSKAKVGVLLLNAWDCGTDQVKYKGSYLDDIKSKLSGKLIESEQEFLSLFHMEKQNSFYILGGNRNTRLERLYTKEEINYLIELSKTYFDIVLIDAGSHFDNSNIVQALNESDLKLLVVNQQMKSIKKFNQNYRNVLRPIGYEKSDFLLVINEYEDKPIYPSTKQIHAEMNIPMLTAIPKNPFGKVAELEEKILFLFDEQQYRASILIIAKTIASFFNLELIADDKKAKRGFFWRREA